MKDIYVVPNGEGPDFDYSQDHVFVKVSSERTGGAWCMVEDWLKPGFYLPRHHHKIMTEVFYVLEGTFELILDSGTIKGTTGDTLTVPPMLWHAAKSEPGARLITIFQNGRFDAYLDKISKMSEADFQNAELMNTIGEEFDIYYE